MSSSITFRSQCKLCDDIFFVPFKDIPYCPRCAKRIGFRYPKSPPDAAARSFPAVPPKGVQADAGRGTEKSRGADAGINSRPGGETTASDLKPQPIYSALSGSSEATPVAGVREANSPSESKPPAAFSSGTPPVEVPPLRDDEGRGPGRTRLQKRSHSSSGGPRRQAQHPGPREGVTAPAAPARITDSLRTSIEHAYEYHAAEAGVTLRDIIDRICLEFGLDRQTVNEVASRVHGERLKQQSSDLNDEQRKAISERYEQMVLAGERPADGRRRRLAREFGFSVNAVTMTISQWRWRHGDPRQLPRESKFEVERQFWQVIHDDRDSAILANDGSPHLSLQEAVRQVATRVTIPLFTVARWVDQLYDDPRLLDHVPLPPPQIRERIEEDYRGYLAAMSPPEESLHRLLADRHGCTVRQAHLTLLLYRWRERLAHLSSAKEDREMVQAAWEKANKEKA